MLKTIKKSFKYLMILIGIIILVPTFFSLLLRMPDVQTYIVRRITRHFSEQIKSTVSIGRFEYTFFNKIQMENVLIKDQNLDTLLYAKKISAGITGINPRGNMFRLGHIEIFEPGFSLITDTTGMTNLNWYLNLLSGSDSSTGKGKTSVSFNQLTVRNGYFRLVDRNSKGHDDRIDFSNLKLSGINGNVEDFHVFNDSVVLRVNDLGFKESNGFLVRSMNSDVTIADQDLVFTDVFLYLDSSIINADKISLDALSDNAFKDFENDVRLDINLRKSSVSAADLKYFAPSLDVFTGWVEVSGRVSGKLSELKGRNIRLSYGSYTYIDCDFDLSGLPRIEDTFIHVGVNTLKTNAKDLDKLKLKGRDDQEYPEILFKLGSVSFIGNFTGFTTDFVTYGKLGSDIGNISTDISLRPEGRNQFRIKGLIRGSDIDLGAITANPELLGKLSMMTNIDGYTYPGKKISGNISGTVDSVEINSYIYRDVALNGLFTEKTWDGSIKIADQNIKLDMLGMLDFRNELPEFDFTMNLGKSDLYRLNIDRKDTTSRLSALFTANFRGNNIDNLFGEIKMLNSTLTKYGSDLELYDFSLKAFNEGGKPAISLRTDFLNADLKGYYEFGKIGFAIKSALAHIMPLKFQQQSAEKIGTRNEFTFRFDFRNTDKINKFFKTRLLLSENSKVEGAFFNDSLFRIKAQARSLDYRNNTLNNVLIEAGYVGNRLSAEINSESLTVLNRSDLKDFRVSLRTVPDSFMFRLNWDNKDIDLNKGEFIADGKFVPRENGAKGSFLQINIDSSGIYNNNNLWKIRKSLIKIDSGYTHFDRFMLASRYNSYTIDGAVSGNKSDTLKIMFRGIELSPLGSSPGSGKNDMSTATLLNPAGTVNGNVLITSALHNPLIESNIIINDLSLLGEQFGDVSVLSAWNSSRKVADINLSNDLDGSKNLDVRGFYDPAVKLLRLNGVASKLPISGLNPLLGFFASGITGTVSGKVLFTMEDNNITLLGSLMAEKASMKVDYLQTRFEINDSIRFDKSGIRFVNTRVNDEIGNPAYLTGSIFHRNFHDFTVDLTINMDRNDCLVMNTTQKDNELFYGTVYASGVTTIRSNSNTLSFDISAKTGKGTRFMIPISSEMSVSDYSFVSFIKHDTSTIAGDRKPAASASGGSSLELNIDVDVTPEAEAELLIDPKAGDVIRGRGEGKLNISLDKKGDFRIFGDYIIEQGDYLFTLQNFINKRFDVESGGTVSFKGNIETAEIDLTARYKNLRTSLYPVLYPILQDEKYKTRIPVEPQLMLSGKLFNPSVGFNIYLPNSDEETRTYLRNAITTQEELSKQVFYLLVMGSFYSDPSQSLGSLSLMSSAGSTTAVAATTIETFSNQVSNWLSQISNDFDVGFNYRPGYKDLNSQELQVALSTQLFNDRVTINGSFDVRGENNTEGTPLSGDFDIEYKITEKIRFKAFNRYNNPYTGRGAPYTQGLGIFFKKDFDKLSDIFRKKENSDMKKEDEVVVDK